MKNCWEILNCDHSLKGENGVLIVCPAYEQNMGHSCWVLAGTFCKTTHIIDEKPKNNDCCIDCIVYQKYNRSSGSDRDRVKKECPEENSKYTDIMLGKYKERNQ